VVEGALMKEVLMCMWKDVETHCLPHWVYPT